MRNPFVLPLLVLFALPLASRSAIAQARSVSGRILDAETSSPLPARVELLDSQLSVTAGPDGRFTLTLDAGGRGTLVISHPGYYVQRLSADPSAAPVLEVRLTPIVTVSDRVEVTATRVREGADPASFTNIPQEKVAETYWAQDPAVLLSQTVPGVFTSNDSGNGIGYSYFSIRGFGQARTRVMLNGAPLNDAESGELFFIDLADFMSTAGDVQVQRGVFGLSGLGGAVDFTTASPAVRPSFTLYYGGGSYGTSRLSLLWDSGLVNGAWSFSARYSKIKTDGYRDQSWVDMWNYYLSAAHYGARSRMRLVLFGGPEQTHLAYNGIDRQTLNGGLTGDPERDRRTNPITWPGEIDNFFQPHYQFVHEVDLSKTTRFSQTLYAFQGDGYYDQYPGEPLAVRVQPAELPGAGRSRHQADRPGPAAQRGRVGRGLGADLHAPGGEAGNRAEWRGARPPRAPRGRGDAGRSTTPSAWRRTTGTTTTARRRTPRRAPSRCATRPRRGSC